MVLVRGSHSEGFASWDLGQPSWSLWHPSEAGEVPLTGTAKLDSCDQRPRKVTEEDSQAPPGCSPCTHILAHSEPGLYSAAFVIFLKPFEKREKDLKSLLCTMEDILRNDVALSPMYVNVLI